jgi:hypothetical protein
MTENRWVLADLVMENCGFGNGNFPIFTVFVYVFYRICLRKNAGFTVFVYEKPASPNIFQQEYNSTGGPLNATPRQEEDCDPFLLPGVSYLKK